MRILSLATVAGAALLVAACGGGAANNTANAPAVDNGTAMGNDMMAPDMNAPMPAATNGMGNGTAAAPAANAAAPAGNTANAM